MLNQHKDLDRGWAWLALVASSVALAVVGGTNYSSGLIHTTLLDRYHGNQVATSWTGALHSALFNIAAPLSAVVTDRYSVRTSLLCGGLLMTVGYLSSAFAPSLTATVFTCGILSGLGGALSWTTAMVSPGFYFRKYRNMAMGIAMAGTSLGLFGIAPAMQAGREAYGATGLFITLSCIAMQMIVCAMIFRPSSLELYTKQRRKEAARATTRAGKIRHSLSGYYKVLTCPPIVLLSVSMFMHCAGHYVVFQYLPVYCMQNGTLPMQTSFLLSVVGLASIFGRLLTGFIASIRNMNEIYIYGANMLLTGISSAFLPLLVNNYTGQIVFSSLLGLFYGGPFVTITPTNIKFVGVSNMAMALGIQLFFGGIGACVAPVLAGLILDNGGTFSHVFVIAGATGILGSLFGLSTIVFTSCDSCRVRFSQSQEKTEVIEEEVEATAPEKERLTSL